MKLALVPLLQVQRDLYETPRGWERFRRYLEVMTGGTGDLVLPIVALNPLGKEHVAATLDTLIALGAETVAAAAIGGAERRLTRVAGQLKVGLVLSDDARGGWTNRYLSEASSRFQILALLKRGWGVALLWTSEQPSAETVRTEVLAAIYRTLYQRAHGLPATLGQMLAQEGLAAAFTGIRPAGADARALASIRAVIEPHRDSTHYPTQFACLYGDEAAVSVGYPALGLPPRGGYALAFEEARRYGFPPEAALVS